MASRTKQIFYSYKYTGHLISLILHNHLLRMRHKQKLINVLTNKIISSSFIRKHHFYMSVIFVGNKVRGNSETLDTKKTDTEDYEVYPGQYIAQFIKKACYALIFFLFFFSQLCTTQQPVNFKYLIIILETNIF